MIFLYVFNPNGWATMSVGYESQAEVDRYVEKFNPSSWATSTTGIPLERAKLVNGVVADTEPEVSIEGLKAKVNEKRLSKLIGSDWTDTASAPIRLGAELYAKWQEHRQALRDITKQPGYPTDVVWPTPPN